MSFDIGAMRTALATKINDAYTAADFAANVYAYPPVNPIGLCVLIDLPEGDAVEYHQTFGATGVAGLALQIEVRVPAGAAADKDALITCDGILGVGTTGSLFDAVSANNYALTDTGWAFVLLKATGPQLRAANDAERFWYSLTFTAALAKKKG